ncbi:MAG: hypothetical protein ACR2JG_14945 [Geodermatophilaceae bacterium]
MYLAALLLAAAILLVWLQVRHVRHVALERRGVLEGAAAALDQPQLVQQGIDYPVLAGFYRGRRVSIALIPDHVALRGLPTLWLSTTLYQALPLPGPIDMLLRPSATDIVSPAGRFPHEHEIPEGWPAHLRIATPAGVLLPFPMLSPVVPLLHDRRTKDVLISPAGVRLITEVARAELGLYRMVRRSRFTVQVTATALAAVLESVHDLAADLEHAVPTGSA